MAGAGRDQSMKPSTGPVPTLIEWDAEVPAWTTLKTEADRAERILFGRAMAREETVGRRPETAC